MSYHEDSSASGQEEPWVHWFCSLKGHEMFCKVERSYIEDGFNLYGLRGSVPNFTDCLDLILDRIGTDESDDSHLTQSACTLYSLIHARYIITAHGLDTMYNKYANKDFGTCPLIQCCGQPVLPLGLRDEMGVDTVKIFCPKCQNVYHPSPIRYRNSAIDGAAFGTTFAHLFLMTFNNLVPDGLSEESAYVPRVFGFRVHPSARQRNANSSIASAAAVGNAATSLLTSGTAKKPSNVTTMVPGVGTGNGATMENHNDDRNNLVDNTVPSKPTVASAAEGKGKRIKRGKSKSEDSGGSSRRKSRNGGDNDESASSRTKRQKRP